MIGKNGNINDKQKLYLLDSQTSVQVIDDIANNVQNEKIISFDYDSHELLTNKKTAHQKSDDFLKEDEIQKIQQQDFKFAEWYDQSSINQFLLYKGINIGRLFHTILFLLLQNIVHEHLHILCCNIVLVTG